MSSRTIVIVIAVVVVGFMLFSLRDYFMNPPKVEAQAPQAPRVLVAKRNLASGSFVQVQNDLDWQPLPESKNKAEITDGGEKADAKKPEYQYEGTIDIAQFNGAVVRRSIRAGDPILPSMVMRSGEGGFMSAVLEPGKRAVSISVNPISGNAGFVSPGDRVDLLITYRIKGEAGEVDAIGTETFIRNVRVLAVDQALDNPENKPILAKTITVEVSVVDAEKISVAAEMGKISVALVGTIVADSVREEKAENRQNYTSGSDVSNLVAKRESATNRVRVIRADKVETLEFYQDK